MGAVPLDPRRTGGNVRDEESRPAAPSRRETGGSLPVPKIRVEPAAQPHRRAELQGDGRGLTARPVAEPASGGDAAPVGLASRAPVDALELAQAQRLPRAVR